MFQEKKVGALLLMAGEGRRFDPCLPKQFHLLRERPLYQYALDVLVSCPFFDEILLVAPSQWVAFLQEKHGSSRLRVISGGESRQASSYRGLQGFHSPLDLVLIHDAARPFLSRRLIESHLETALVSGAVNTCIASTDTLVWAPEKDRVCLIPKREYLLRGQTPQTFLFTEILEAHRWAVSRGTLEASCDCSLIAQRGREIAIVRGDERNLKVTSRMDWVLAEQLLLQNV